MDNLRVVVTDASGGQHNLKPSRLQLQRSVKNPAGSFTGEFEVVDTRLPMELINMRLISDDVIVFEGKIIEQNGSISQKGMMMTLEVKPQDTLQFDNQVLPTVPQHFSCQSKNSNAGKIIVELPGFHNLKPGDSMSINQCGFSADHVVDENIFTLSEEGMRTKLMMMIKMDD